MQRSQQKTGLSDPAGSRKPGWALKGTRYHIGF